MTVQSFLPRTLKCCSIFYALAAILSRITLFALKKDRTTPAGDAISSSQRGTYLRSVASPGADVRPTPTFVALCFVWSKSVQTNLFPGTRVVLLESLKRERDANFAKNHVTDSLSWMTVSTKAAIETNMRERTVQYGNLIRYIETYSHSNIRFQYPNEHGADNQAFEQTKGGIESQGIRER